MTIHDQSPMNGCFGDCQLAISATPEEFLTAVAVPICIDGEAGTVAVDATIPVSAGHTTLAASQTCIFLVVATLAGAVSTVQSEILTTAQLLDESLAIQIPEIPDGTVPIGYIKVSTNSSGSFIPVTDAFSDSNVYDEFVSIMGGLPARAVSGLATGYAEP